MFKNSKLLKGIVISLAFVLVLGGAFLLKQWVEASEKVVVFYVDDKGDNTTGKDIASAYTTIGDATAAATAMGLEPGTEVRIIVGEQITLTTQSIDVNIAKDKNGDKLPVVLTSMNTDHPDNYAVIYQAYRISGTSGAVPTDGSQRSRIINHLTMKDIVYKAKVHEVYTNNKDTGKPIDLYRVKRLFVDGNDVTFDNVRFTTDLGDYIDGSVPWTIYCDDCTAGTKKDSPTVTFKNGDYSNAYIYGNSAIMPNYDITINFENATISTLYAIANSDKTSNVNCNSLKVNFKDTHVKSFYPFNGGDYTIPGGVEYTFDNTTLEIFRTKGRESEVLTGDLTWNFKGDTVIDTDNSTLYLAPVKALNGNLTTNFSGGTFDDSVFVSGISCKITGDVVNNVTGGNFMKYFAAGARTGTIDGNVTNNISGNPVFTGRFLGGHGVKTYATDPASSVGNIVNNISGNPTFKNTFYGGSLDGNVGDITNRVNGAVVFEQSFFGGAGEGTVLKNSSTGAVTFSHYPTTGNIENVVNGAIIQSSFYGGSQMGTSGDVRNEVFGDNTYGDLFISYYYGGGATGSASCGNVKNTLERVIVDKSYCGGGCADVTGDIQNILEDNVTVKNYFYGGSYVGASGNISNRLIGEGIVLTQLPSASFSGGNRSGASGNVRTEITSAVTIGLATNAANSKTNYYYGGNLAGNCGDVENIITGKANIESVFAGGNKADNMGNVYNEITGGAQFKDYVYFSSYASNGTTVGETITKVTDATFDKFVCASPVFNNGGKVLAHFTSDKVSFKQSYYGGPYNATGKATSVTNYITDGVQFLSTASGQRVWLGGHSGTVTGNLENIISGVTFKGNVHGGSRKGTLGDIYNQFSACTFEKSVYAGSQADGANCTTGNIVNNFTDGVVMKDIFYGGNAAGAGSVAGNITNYFSGVTFEKMYLGGTVQGKSGDTINILDNVTFKGNYYGGGYNANSDVGVVSNYITSGANFAGIFYAANSDGKNAGVNNYIMGSVTFPKNFFGGSKKGTCGDITNTVYAGATFTTNFYGGSETDGSTCGNITNTFANGTVNGEFIGGNAVGGTCGDIRNIIYGQAVLNGKYTGGTGGSKSATVVANITNEIYTGTFKAAFIAGCPGTISSVTNTISGNVTFQKDYYGGYYGASANVQNVVNNITGASFTGADGVWFSGQGKGGQVQKVTNNLNDVTFTGKVYAGTRSGGNCTEIVNNITDCEFRNIFSGANSSATDVGNCGTITNNVQGDSVFSGTYIGGTEKGTVNSIVNNFYGVTITGTYVEGSKSPGTATSVVTNVIPAGSPDVILP